MKDYKYIILGAGPSGLTTAHALISGGCPKESVLVVEANDEVGGLCRSQIVDGAPLDTGGGHFLDLKHERVIDFLFQFMPRTEWQQYSRVSKIRLHNRLIDHPLEANLWQLATELQADYLESIAIAGCNSGESMPEAFSEWVSWKLGDKIAEEYMIPYNEKIWGLSLNELGTYWLYKLPNVSFRETLLSCLNQSPEGALPAHGTFLYPKEYGYGEVWRRMGVALEESLELGTPVESIGLADSVVNGKWRATEKIITTIPWTNWGKLTLVPNDILRCMAELKKASIDVTYNPKNVESNAHWIYDPDIDTAHHRQLLRSNFVESSRGHWTETNTLRSDAELKPDQVRFHNEYAYPINTVDKPIMVEQIGKWAAANSIIPLGRWGRWEHMNSDIAVLEALRLVDRLVESS